MVVRLLLVLLVEVTTTTNKNETMDVPLIVLHYFVTVISSPLKVLFISLFVVSLPF